MDAKRSYVLLVEDDEAYGQLLKEFLEKARGLEVVLEGTLAGAFRRARKRIPGMVLFDMNLPDGDGAVLCQGLKKIWGNRTILKWVLSASPPLDWDPRPWASFGVQGYLSKTAGLEAILRAVESALAGGGECESDK